MPIPNHCIECDKPTMNTLCDNCYQINLKCEEKKTMSVNNIIYRWDLRCELLDSENDDRYLELDVCVNSKSTGFNLTYMNNGSCSILVEEGNLEQLRHLFSLLGHVMDTSKKELKDLLVY